MIWAQARGGVIGADGGMPWHVPEDMAHFKEITMGAPVVMGRRTWESFPERFRPLPGRRNIVVTRNDGWTAAGAEPAASVDAALALAAEGDPGTGTGRTWIIGGGQVYREALARADRLEVTELDLDVAGDTTAPSTEGWRVVASDPADGWHTSRSGIRYRFVRYER
ncbi:dihydrofolate reductase [Microbacterium horticulturae]|uniref:Dihydrofolate reductase n=1 Tax=Microbacterium horticulturae TaxID=3028316 RepID=A0ABY8BW35_9MICO|nr:dihydrofolate reductase [Microbacterium sp. KACC 23027]WEG07727.1 dihydrofolate reductase [Microbacterium sp. KACC 23027]